VSSIDSLIKKIKRLGANMYLADWINEFEVPDEVKESPLELVACMKQALEWKASQGLKDHPSSVVSHILETSDVNFSVDKIEVISKEDENTIEKVYVSDQSYYVLEGSQNDKIVVNAQISDYLAYGCRINKDFSISDSFGMKNCSTLLLPYAKFTDVMGVFLEYLQGISGNGVRSPALVRDALYTNFEEMSGLSIYLWALFNERTKSGEYDEVVKKICDKAKTGYDYLPPVKGFCHVTQTLSFPTCESVDYLYTLVNAHTQLRGEESGLGALNNCYYWNSLPRAVSKIITRVVEIMEICRLVRTKIITVESEYLTDYEKNVLVKNGITIIDQTIMSVPCTEDSVVGVYGSTKLPTISIYKRRGSMPRISKKGVEHTFEPDHIKNLFPSGNFFFKIYIHDGLASLVRENGLYFHPVLNPSRPEVYITNVETYKDISLKMLIQRCAKATYYRTLFPYNRLPFVVVDIYSPVVGVTESLKLCRRGGKIETVKSVQTVMQAHEDISSKVVKRKTTIYSEFVDLSEEVDERPKVVSRSEIIEKFRNELAVMVMANDIRKLRVSGVYSTVSGILKGKVTLIPLMYRELSSMTFEELGSELPVYADFLLAIRNDVLEVPAPKVEKQLEKPRVNAVIENDNDLVGDFSMLSMVSKRPRKRENDDNES